MYCNIKSLIIYGTSDKGEESRTIDFKTGSLNIITGSQSTGKTGILEIIDYCLGSDTKPSDKISRCVDWFGILFEFSDKEFFIARKSPHEGNSSELCSLSFGKKVDVPKTQSDIVYNYKIKDALKELANQLGIGLVAFGKDRHKISLRHSLEYMFQDYDTIDSKHNLFYGANKNTFRKKAIIDTISYFLDAIPENELVIEREIKELNAKLKKEEELLNGIKEVTTRNNAKLDYYINKLVEFGFLAEDTIKEILQKKPSRKIEFLNNFLDNTMKTEFKFENKNTESNGFQKDIDYMREEVGKIDEDIKQLSDEIKRYDRFIDLQNNYVSHSQKQMGRLKSIELYPKDYSEDRCPFCNNVVETNYTNVELLKDQIKNLDNNINIETTYYNRELTNRRSKLENKKKELVTTRKSYLKELDSFIEENKKLKEIQIQDYKKVWFLGNVNAFLESYVEPKEKKEHELKKEQFLIEIEEKSNLLSPELKEKRLDNALSEINAEMTKMSKELNFEYNIEKAFLTFDNKNLTLNVHNLYNDESVLSLSQTGSSANHLCLHLVTFLALHKFFLKHERPVPPILILDQPTKPFFEPDHAENKDQEDVEKIYNLMFKVVRELSPNFQLIVLDHAFLSDRNKYSQKTCELFEKYMLEDWHLGGKLVPDTWISEKITDN
ncbi:uncharacterized protein YlxW (UPF0749 family) [Methanococcus maripaludis]|uniref:Uncharacterized protein YlxW (UPF0749 family) n=1 Tax=Methanococcus maripaludis TaxID=39152 RepID=A0A7J9S2L2_METMI|nr:DUF3732 domain-containing protein [Methanococcus maripaludis]MBB6400981.1 uncharacterized protein YlxW (UPF0749 family) [Methanococcus maripaludis]